MPRIRPALMSAVLTAALAAITACDRADVAATGSSVTDDDPAFAALQERGEEFMGVDQYTSTHRFDALADGGRIELQRDVDDPAGVARIRSHLREIEAAFAAGDFSIPARVHDREVPGTAVMAERKDRIRYVYGELPRGAELRLVTDDPDALRAIHEFLAFQRDDHRAGGMEHHRMHHEGMDHEGMHHEGMHHEGMHHEGTNHHGPDHDGMDDGGVNRPR